jgi:S1-C subfamily serine protease
MSEGKLVGVGSILTSFILPGVGRVPCNMFVPIDLLKPILGELVRTGRSGMLPRPWLGVSTAEIQSRVVVTMVTPGGPSEQAGLRPGDVVLAVAQRPVAGVAEFYRLVWATGTAGVNVRLRVLQGDSIREIGVKSVDRNERLRPSPSRPGRVAASPVAAR